MSPDVFKTIAYSLTGLTIGFVAYALTIHVPHIFQKTNRSIHLGVSLISLAWMVSVLSIGAIISRNPPAEVTWRGLLYLTSLGIGLIGFGLMAKATRRMK